LVCTFYDGLVAIRNKNNNNERQIYQPQVPTWSFRKKEREREEIDPLASLIVMISIVITGYNRCLKIDM
jgi:hypothetical protein